MGTEASLATFFKYLRLAIDVINCERDYEEMIEKNHVFKINL